MKFSMFRNLSFVGAAAASFFFASNIHSKSLEVTQQEKLVTELVGHIMSGYHYSKKPLDDKASAEIFERFFKSLDPQRRIFLATDLKEFGKYKLLLDDMYKVGDLSFADRVFDRFRLRLAQREQYVTKALAKVPQVTNEEVMKIDRAGASWHKTAENLDELWRLMLENEYISAVISDRSRVLKAEEKKEKYIPKTEAQLMERVAKSMRSRLKNMQELERDDIFELAIGMMTHIYDPHSSYMGPKTMEEFEIAMRLSLSGIGATLSVEDGYIRIESVVPGGPAARSGQLQSGDYIYEVAQGEEEAVSVVDKNLRKSIRLIRGKKGTTVVLGVLRGGLNGEQVKVTIVRDVIKMEDSEARSEVFEVDTDEGKKKVGVIYLPSFYLFLGKARDIRNPEKSCVRDVQRELAALKKAGVDSIVFDLRNNGGGSLHESIRLTGLFIDGGPVVQVRNTRGEVDVKSDREPGYGYRGPLVVLINQHSASASEIFAAAIQDYGRGVIVGASDRTHGKGTVQEVLPLNRLRPFNSQRDFNPGELKYTIAKFYRVNGGSTQRKGVVPDIALPHFYDKKNEGEATLPHALAYDEIAPADIECEGELAPMIEALKTLSDKRIATSVDFTELQKEIAYLKTRIERKSISLTLDKRRAEFDAYTKRKKERQHALRHLAGRELESDEESSEDEKGELDFFRATMPGRKHIHFDLYLREAANISCDLKKKSSQPNK